MVQHRGDYGASIKQQLNPCLMHHDLNDLGSSILVGIIPEKQNLLLCSKLK